MELTTEQKIKYADIIARVLIAVSIIFIGYGAVVSMMQDKAMGNTIMFSGLIFVALAGVAIYVKKTLEKQIDSGKTFHAGGS